MFTNYRHSTRSFIILSSLLLFISNNCISQNVVQNPSWESNTGLPTGQDQVSFANGWTGLITNSDYMWDGSFNGWTPQNGGAYDGSGYVGFGGYQWTPDYSEALGGYLETPIVGGESYTVSVALQVTNGISGAGDFSGTCMGLSIFGFTTYTTDEFFPGHLNDVGGSWLLWSSEPVANTEWEIYTGCFTAPIDINYIGLSLSPNVACHQYIFVDMLEIMPATGSILGEDVAICNGDNLIIPELDADSFEWNNGQTEGDFIVTEPGTYWVDYVMGPCTLSDTITVELENFEDFTLGPDQTVCEGEEIVLSTEMTGESYVWQDGSEESDFLATETGTYNLTIFLSPNCAASDTVNLEFIPIPILDLGEDILSCIGDSIELFVGVEDGTYEWNDGTTEESLTVFEDGLYSVTIDNEGCQAYDEILVQFREYPITILPSDSVICEDQFIILNVNSPFASYEWMDGSEDSEFVVNQAGIYSVEITTPCETSLQSINIVESECGCELFIPSAFTHNQDGINEQFRIYTECSLQEFHLRIFNRMGQIVFETFDEADSWDGYFQGELQPVGLYNYWIDYKKLDTEKLEKLLGHVLVLR